ncbi:MAG: winged helix-turn-helix domain-containing protein, partial [Pseudomonadota bacterium]
MAFYCLNDNLSAKFYINGFLVDTKRGVVSCSSNNRDEEVVLEPKVMALLKVLVKNHQQVLSSEELFEQVWPNGIYSPNSVRRNIALLRQAFLDEQKSIVKTHPKRGYSLEADIRFVENIGEKNEPTRFQKNEKSPLVFFIALLSFFIIGTVLFGYYFQNINVPTKTRLANLMPITASNGSERYMQVSPDGRFMAFIQSTQDTQKRLLLIKDLVTNTEWLLNDESKAYTYLAWESHTNSLIYSHKTAKGIEFVRLYLNKQHKRISESVLFSRNDISWNSVFYIDSKQQLF